MLYFLILQWKKKNTNFQAILLILLLRRRNGESDRIFWNEQKYFEQNQIQFHRKQLPSVKSNTYSSKCFLQTSTVATRWGQFCLTHFLTLLRVSTFFFNSSMSFSNFVFIVDNSVFVSHNSFSNVLTRLKIGVKRMLTPSANVFLAASVSLTSAWKKMKLRLK